MRLSAAEARSCSPGHFFSTLLGCIEGATAPAHNVPSEFVVVIPSGPIARNLLPLALSKKSVKIGAFPGKGSSHMKIPETLASVSELDLMKRLQAYEKGEATWHRDRTPLGENAKKASRALHTRIVEMVEKVLAPIMDRATARELDTFTMHDRVHGRKVAHLMWHILSPERQLTLTPPEIGLLVLSAHLHDAGMALSREDREKRLAPESNLWDRVEASPTIKRNLKRLREVLADTKLTDSKRLRVEGELFQAEEALLALDTRERHALRERYEEIITQLRSFHLKNPTKIPDVEECFSFDGDSFRKKLIDICVSHNEDSDALVERTPSGLIVLASHVITPWA